MDIHKITPAFRYDAKSFSNMPAMARIALGYFSSSGTVTMFLVNSSSEARIEGRNLVLGLIYYSEFHVNID
jgi:hypothetical protein